MTSGRGGSDVEPCTGVSFAALLRPNGDEDLAPLVLAMADRKEMARGARGLDSDEGANEQLFLLGFSLAPFHSSNDRF